MSIILEPVIRQRYLTVTKSVSGDVAKHYLLFEKEGSVTRDSVNIEITQYTDPSDQTRLRVPLHDLFGPNSDHPLSDGEVVSFGVYAVDEAGNKSGVYQSDAWLAVPLDFIPPEAPSNGSLSSID